MKNQPIYLLAIAVLVTGCKSMFKIDVRPAEDISVEATPARLERGAYLANNVAACINCHSKRDFSLYAAPSIAGTEAGGGARFGPEQGVPGIIFSRNITPAGVGEWTDGELLRAITTGATPDGRALFPIMPYLNYGQFSREDAYAIVAYIRTLKPIDNQIPDRELDFLMRYIVKKIPDNAALPVSVDMPNSVGYGKYLATIAGCSNCHTVNDNMGRPVMEKYFAGGLEFPLPSGGIVRASNITPDMETGIGRLSRNNFIGRFKAFDNEESRRIKIPVAEQDENTIMPWPYYAGMTAEDLGTIYDYLITVNPVVNRVIKNTDRDGKDILN